ncbi:MAG: restriction endonuclease subunit S, partial [Desulfuromonadaceae bacterium]|nr:restriction endonuclease subunit S [Desulfuromonadaceae bacterium]
MGGRYRAYNGYKSSDVQWLGEILKLWKITQIKHIGCLKGGAGFPHSEQGVSGEYLDVHKVNALGSADDKGILQSSENSISVNTASRLGAYIFPANSIVFAKVGAALLLSRIRLVGTPACIDNNMMGLVVNEQNDFNFIRYSMCLVRFDYLVNPGAIPSLNEFQIGNSFLAIPSIEEQKKIANFLDYETAKIDTLIDKQQQLIKLLKEKRQAVISHAVTKGLNPAAPM